jgi:hypothetical protein
MNQMFQSQMEILKDQLANTLQRQAEVQNQIEETSTADLSTLIEEDRFLGVRIDDLCRMVYGKPASQVDWEAYWSTYEAKVNA